MHDQSCFQLKSSYYLLANRVVALRTAIPYGAITLHSLHMSLHKASTDSKLEYMESRSTAEAAELHQLMRNKRTWSMSVR